MMQYQLFISLLTLLLSLAHALTVERSLTVDEIPQSPAPYELIVPPPAEEFTTLTLKVTFTGNFIGKIFENGNSAALELLAVQFFDGEDDITHTVVRVEGTDATQGGSHVRRPINLVQPYEVVKDPPDPWKQWGPGSSVFDMGPQGQGLWTGTTRMTEDGNESETLVFHFDGIQKISRILFYRNDMDHYRERFFRSVTVSDSLPPSLLPFTFGDRASYCVTSATAGIWDEPPYFEIGVGKTALECIASTAAEGYMYANFWSQDGLCRGLNECPFEYDCVKKGDCLDYDLFVRTFTVGKSIPETISFTFGDRASYCVTSANAGVWDKAYFSEMGMGMTVLECIEATASEGYMYASFWSQDGLCRGLNECPYEYDCVKKGDCLDYDLEVRTFTIQNNVNEMMSTSSPTLSPYTLPPSGFWSSRVVGIIGIAVVGVMVFLCVYTIRQKMQGEAKNVSEQSESMDEEVDASIIGASMVDIEAPQAGEESDLHMKTIEEENDDDTDDQGTAADIHAKGDTSVEEEHVDKSDIRSKTARLDDDDKTVDKGAITTGIDAKEDTSVEEEEV